MKRILFTLVFLLSVHMLSAQCAMCRATLENNLSNGDLVVGAGINVGILYLFVTPYLAIGFLAWNWYRKSRKNTTSFNT